jgi:hypothetical protein
MKYTAASGRCIKRRFFSPQVAGYPTCSGIKAFLCDFLIGWLSFRACFFRGQFIKNSGSPITNAFNNLNDPSTLLSVAGQASLSDAFNDLHEALTYALEGRYRVYEVDICVALAWTYLANSEKQKNPLSARCR